MKAAEYLVSEGWPQVVSLLPDDLEQRARDDKAIIRQRKIRDGATLLRIILAYGLAGLSSRALSSWLELCGLDKMSSISLLQRMRWSEYWLADLLAEMLEENAEAPGFALGGRNIIIQDATTASRPHAQGTDRRVHLTFSLVPYRIVAIELTDDSIGETFTRIDAGFGDIVLGDRGYAHRKGISYVVGRGADVVVRINWQNVPLTTESGDAFDITAHLEKMDTEISEWAVYTRADENRDIPAIGGRVIAKAKDAESAAKERKRIIREAKKKHREPDPRSLIAAGFILVFTTLSVSEASADQVMELYRYRWQIEIVFKRLKSILNLDDLPDCTDELMDTIILARLIGAILIEKIASRSGAFSPSVPAGLASCECGTGLEDDIAGDNCSGAGLQHACGFA